jgi:diguanylate cyclase (GGDEF)-like protein/PAS domain S-box-containing protein
MDRSEQCSNLSEHRVRARRIEVGAALVAMLATMSALLFSARAGDAQQIERQRGAMADELRVTAFSAALVTSHAVFATGPDDRASTRAEVRTAVGALQSQWRALLATYPKGDSTANAPVADAIESLVEAASFAAERQDPGALDVAERAAQRVSDTIGGIRIGTGERERIAMYLSTTLAVGGFLLALLVFTRERRSRARVALGIADATLVERDRLDRMFAQLHDVVLILSPAGDPTWVSNSFARVLGLEPPSDRAGMLALCHPDDEHELRELLRRCLDERGSTVTGEARVATGDGGHLPMRIVATDHSADPKIGGLLISLADLTAEKAAAAELALALSHHSFLAESSSEMLVRADDNGVMSYVSAAAEELLHVTPSNLVGWTFQQLVMVDDWEIAEAAFADTRRTGRKVTVDVRVITAMIGTWRWVNLTVRHLVGPTGAPEFHVSLRDITERRRAELAVQEAAREQQRIIDTLAEGVVLAERGEGLVRVNQAATEMFGYVAGGNRSFRDVAAVDTFHDLDGTILTPDDTAAERVFRTGQPQLGRLVEQRRADGRSRWFRVDAVPFATREDEVTHALTTFADVTDIHLSHLALQASEERFRLLADNARDIVSLLDIEGRFTYLSPSVRTVLGHEPEEWVGRAFLDAVHPDDAAVALRGGLSGDTVLCRLRHVDGTYRWIETSVTLVRDGDRVIGFQQSSRDVDDRVRAQQRLERERQFLDATLGAVQSAVIAIDRTGCVVETNGMWLEFTGFVPKPGTHLSEFPLDNMMLDDDGVDVPFDRRPLERALAGEQVTDEPYQMVSIDGTRRHVLCSAVPLSGDGGVVQTIHDITALRDAQDELVRLATVDALTGLPNRRRLMEHLEAAVARNVRHARALRVVFIDLDGFKPVNDTHGHEAGDELLQQVGQRLQLTCRSGDLVARIGGDEFVVVLEPMVEDEKMARFVERVDEAIRQPFVLRAGEVQISASIGTVTFQIGDSADSLLAASDAAMYREKRNRASSRALTRS